MTKKWIGINLLLLIAAVLAGRQLYNSVQQFKAENNLEKIQPDPALNQKIAQESALPPSLPDKNYNASDFVVIPDKNLFAESRTDKDAAGGDATDGIMSQAQKPILVGVMLAGDEKFATILEPQGRGRSSQAQTKRIGDTYMGYAITEITPDHIVLDNGRQKEIISLSESPKTAQSQRGRTAATPTRVVSIGSAAASGNIPVTVVSGARSPTRSPAGRGPNVEPESGARNSITPIPVVQAGGQPEISGVPIPEPAETVQPASQTPASTPRGTQQRPRVIRGSPFGDIIRPDP
jgi:hypothetical protein